MQAVGGYFYVDSYATENARVDAAANGNGIHIPQQCCVAPVAPASFLFCHMTFFLFFRFCFFSPTLPQVGPLFRE